MTITWQSIVISVVSIILTGLASWGVKVLVAWLNTKIKNEKVKAILNQAIDTITGVVQATYQTFVQSLKASGSFDTQAQEKALNQAVEAAKAQLSAECTAYLSENKINADEWLKTQIESIIYKLKNK